MEPLAEPKEEETNDDESPTVTEEESSIEETDSDEEYDKAPTPKSDSEDELDSDVEWEDPREKITCKDQTYIRTIRFYDICAIKCAAFMAKGNEPGTQAPSAIKAGLKMLSILLYYGPFLFYLTHNYPTNKDGCLVETGSAMWWDPEALIGEGTVTFRCIRKIGLAPSQFRLLDDEDEDEDDPDYPRFLKAGGGGGGKGGSKGKAEGANAGEGEIGDEDEDKYDFGDAEEDGRPPGVEPENYTSLFRFWYFYGIVWFTFAGLVDCLNVINGRDLCARKSVCYIGGALSVLWYIAGGILIASPGGKVASGEYTNTMTFEEWE